MIAQDKAQIQKAVERIEKILPDKDVFDTLLFQQYYNTTVSSDFKRKDLKRINVKKTKFSVSSFEAAAATGSKFTSTEFYICNFSGANFQDCYFNSCKFAEKTLIEGANFSNSIFIDCNFENIIIRRSTFFDCRFENCKFESCEIYSDTTENSVLYNCEIFSTDLAHINLEYIQIENVLLNKITLPPYQIPYIIGAPTALLKATGVIEINTDNGNITKEKYCELYPELSLYFLEHKEYFPLANLLIANKQYGEALDYIKIGIEQASTYVDFRMIKHFCRLACLSGSFTPQQLKELYNLITQLSYDSNWDLNTLHSYMLHIGAIKELLLNNSSSGKQCAEIVIKTNIDKYDLASINELYNRINEIIQKECSEQHTDFIELRHNSPYELYVTCIDSLPQILGVLTSVYTFLLAGNKVVDIYKNLGETKRVWQENKLYKYQEEQMQLDIQLKKMEIQQKQKGQDNIKSSSIYTITEVEHNIKCSTLDIAKTIAPELLHYKYTKVPEY